MPKKVIVLVQPKIDERTLESARKRMEWACGFMTVRYHFVYQMLAMMTKKVVPGHGTMGVGVLGSGQFLLGYDPMFVLELKDEALTYVLYHEILHLALHHCTHRQYDNKELANIAHDLAVNELIPVVPRSCEPPRHPDGSLMGTFVSELKKLKDFSDIKEKQTAEWYYDYLLSKAKASGGGSAKGKGKGKQSGFDDHGGWKEDEIGDEKVRAKIDEINKGELWGDVGGAEKELILAAQHKRINWRNVLRQFYGSMISHEKESTRKRPNRRLGYVHPGTRKLQLDRHLVAVDTSGSIPSDLLAEFLGIINQMTDYVPIDVMQCDCGVTDTPRPFDRRRCEFTFKGRGGTSFDPIMQVVNERHYKSVVILTDGAAPECIQPTAQTVWVLPEGCNPPVEWGKRIHMSRHA